jgi:hypothetical protein
VFWGTLAYTLIGGTLAGTVLTLLFLPAMYAIWFKISPATDSEPRSSNEHQEDIPASRAPALVHY